MSWLPGLRARLCAFFRGGALDQERTEEIRFHMEEAVRRNLNRGMPADEARRQVDSASAPADISIWQPGCARSYHGCGRHIRRNGAACQSEQA